ncbi:hypothetical protein SOASR030_17440 [Leminorella grimontii]|uniref:Cellulose biosynthesis protein BcsR n=1 Tax=Leminorella grimontii TaxID=82981 RepID=A0AAV5N4L7_9GAMM|nr:cellulose biosynthesis protein BcsR [Leminorella grimontii]KFC93670.1 hypothetical protein GLGR_3235 [Leminorella grimontii ATCC 33999 = DSM 5078]GKX55632.1 hypothetical protein SOASR030_17440 [Leminorella grimontii]VFS55472.1 Protein of uncharacterised function (DUF2629) [Leminorella grimontii]
MSDEITDADEGQQQGRNQTQGLNASNGDRSDIVAVAKAYHLSSVDYQDFSGSHALAAARSRWPLLAELHDKKVEA